MVASYIDSYGNADAVSYYDDSEDSGGGGGLPDSIYVTADGDPYVTADGDYYEFT